MIMPVLMVMIRIVLRMFVFMAMKVFMEMHVRMIRAVRGFLFHAVYGYAYMRSGDAAFYGRFGSNPHSGQTGSIYFADKRLSVFRQLQQRRGQHVARGTHAAFQIQRFHSLFLLAYSETVRLFSNFDEPETK